MLKTTPPLLLALFLLAALVPPALAQQPQYVSDDVFIVLHAGPGTNYRWLAKLTPGMELSRGGDSEDGEWTEVTTSRGTQGWVRTEFLAGEPPAQARLPRLERQLQESQRNVAELRSDLTRQREEQATLQAQFDDTRSQLQTVTEELAQLRQVSGSAVETAQQNRRLVTEAEAMRTQIDTLEADNQRLQDRVRSSAFLDGAIAVGLGVIITLVVPRLWPRRRRSSSWA